MSPKRLEHLLQHMSESLKEKDIIKDFPSIIDDLEYIVRAYKLKIKGLTDEQRINNVYNIEQHRIEFLAELMKKYMILKQNNNFSYEMDEGRIDLGKEKFIITSGGYIQEEDTVVLSVLGMLLNAKNTADVLKRITHEYCHQNFFHFMHENSIEGILKYPPYFIIVAKNYIPKPLHAIFDENDKFIRNQYYDNNHSRMYTEVDANVCAIETVKKFLLELYDLYPNKNKKLESKVSKLQQELINESEIVEEELKKDQEIEPKYLCEIYLKKPISSTLLVDGEEKDALLYTDKTLKNNPILKGKYEVLNILMNDYEFKSYHELIFDKYNAISKYGNKEKISAIYDNIINTDPMVLITKLVIEKDINGINKFLSNHPTFKDEYKEEIDKLFSTQVTDSMIINLLSKEESIIKKKETKH